MSALVARPTVYRGIHMRSRLEARVAAKLDEYGVTWAYEPRAYADETGQYLPDFEVEPGGGYPTLYIEAKPTMAAAYAVMDRMEIIRSSDPEALLVIVVPDQPAIVGWPDEPWMSDDSFGLT